MAQFAQLIGLTLYLALLLAFFAVVAPILLGLGLAIASLALLSSYLHALYDCFNGRLSASLKQSPRGKEPAFTSYFFYKAYLDIGDAWLRTWDLSYAAISPPVERLMNWSFKGEASTYSWPLGLVAAAVGIAAAPLAAALFVALFALHGLIVVVIGVLLSVAAIVLWSAELLLMLWRQARYVCPHPNCYRRMPLPEYHCPHCNAAHHRLLPGSYGVLRRKCACGSLIPASALFGRRNLAAYCPFCKGELSGIIGAAQNLYVPVVGGPSTGKSTAVIRAGMALAEVFRPPAGQLRLPDRDDAQRFERESRELEGGGKLLKTTELSPRAFLLLLDRPRRRRSLLYMYDAAGELYRADGDDRRRQRYLRYATGFFFLIDPFSIPSVRTTYAEALAAQPEIEPSDEPPQSVYDRLMNVLREAGSYPQRISVVVTKVDAFDLGEQLLPLNGHEGQSQAVRRWLVEHGEHNLVMSLEKDFRQVRYFGAILRGPAFRPAFVLDPLAALLGWRDIADASAVAGANRRSFVPRTSLGDADPPAVK